MYVTGGIYKYIYILQYVGVVVLLLFDWLTLTGLTIYYPVHLYSTLRTKDWTASQLYQPSLPARVQPALFIFVVVIGCCFCLFRRRMLSLQARAERKTLTSIFGLCVH